MSLALTSSAPTLALSAPPATPAQLAVSPSILGLFVVGCTVALVLMGVLDRLSDGAVRGVLSVGDDEPGSGLPPEATLSDEEQFVVDLLEDNDGQIRQSEIVEASDWSKSKVSRLLSRMEAEGHLEKVAVGRENVIALPGEGPDR